MDFYYKITNKKLRKLYDYLDDHTIIIELLEEYYNIYSEIKYFFRKNYNNVVHLIKWFPIIWNDRQWDDHFFFLVLQKKLNLMEEYFVSDKSMWALCNDKKLALKRLRICSNLVKRIIDDNYLSNALDAHEKVYGKCEFKFKPISNSKNSEIVIVNEKANVYSDEFINKSRKHWYKHSDKMKKQDIDMLFKLLSKNIERYWD